MHPRNIYKDSARAIGYAEKDPFVAQFLIQEKGKKRFGSLDDQALRQLSKILLKEDFNLDIDFPPNGLVPTIPLRLNYILWLEDLLNDFEVCSYRNDERSSNVLQTGQSMTSNSRIHGIDIGTGGSSIYAILAARKNNWVMVGTETNPESFEFARRNISANSLENNVRVMQVDSSNYFDKICTDNEGITFDFSMCNPPFFGSPEETESTLNSRTEHRPQPANEKTGVGSELFVEGGEIKFVSDMILESLIFKSRIRIFTTMVGVKAHVPILVKLLKQQQTPNVIVTEFVQGRTRRWGLAWSFFHNHKMSNRNSIPDKLSNTWLLGMPNPPKPIQAEVSIENGLPALQAVIATMFTDLKLQLIHSKKSKDADIVQLALEYVGFENSWSNARRRRREEARALQQKAETQSCEEVTRSPKQIKTAETSGSINAQNVSQSHAAGAAASAEPDKLQDDSLKKFESCDCNLGIVHFYVILHSCSPVSAQVTFVHIEGTSGPEGMHQVFQYMKNTLLKHDEVTNVVLSH